MSWFSQSTFTIVCLFIGLPLYAEEALFERDVLPLLTKNCLGCHGGLRQKGDLDMRTLPALLKGGKSGPAVKAKDLEQSSVWERIASDDMPPGEKKLSAAEKQIIRNWIEKGLPTVAQRQIGDKPRLEPNQKHDPQQVARAIDEHIDDFLKAAKITPAPRSDDAEFLRRIFLDLTGRVPTAEQAKMFLESQDNQKRSKLIDSLLDSPQFGEQLGRTWREWICPPELPSDPNGGKQPYNQANDFGKWLAARFNANESWDQITKQILTVEGEIKNQPQVIFFGLVGEGGKVTANGTARAVSSLFLGVQMQCAECHDDPYRSWSQKENWSLAAFFSKVTGDFNKVNEPKGGIKNGQIVIPKSAFKNAGTQVPPAFLDGSKLESFEADTLRQSFTTWLIRKENPFFARAFANRMWFYFFSRGIVNPIDDFRELNPASHPALMKLLSNEFAASGFDIKHFIRCLCNSETYQRTSKVPAGMTDEALTAQTAAFGRMPLRVMTADTLLESLKQIYGDPKLDLRSIDNRDGNTFGESAAVGDAYLEFLRRFGTNEEDSTDFTHGIPQMLTLINHPKLLSGSKSLDAYLKSNPSAKTEQVISWLYLSTLSRQPTDSELSESLRYLQKVKDSNKGYAGILWSLINRSEFIFIR